MIQICFLHDGLSGGGCDIKYIMCEFFPFIKNNHIQSVVDFRCGSGKLVVPMFQNLDNIFFILDKQ